MEQFCQDNNIAIVGGGPSGIFCAIQILREFKKYNFKNYSLTIFDKSQILRTILPTGNGRCNITNAINDKNEFLKNYPRGREYFTSLYRRFNNKATIDFFNSIGIETYVQENNRIFPKSNSSKDVKDKLLNELNKFSNVFLKHKEINNKANLNKFDYIVVSAGSHNSENIIEFFGHSYNKFKKVLIGLKIKNTPFIEGLTINSLDGDFVTTKNGISGPLAFKISSLCVEKALPYDYTINLFSCDEIMNTIKLNPKKSIGSIISTKLPKAFVKSILNIYDKKASEVSKKDIINFSKLTITIISTENNGEITNAGGVELSELDKNCMSKKHSNLWFCGEILNIDGMCGGFNLQNCWTTGYVVAKDITKRILNKEK